MLELLVGTIASGKSTYATRRALKGALIVSDDDIVTMLHGGQYTMYDESLKPVYKEIEHTMIVAGLTHGRDVVVDRPCLSLKQRAYYLALASRLDKPCQAAIFTFSSPGVHADRRMKHDARGYGWDKWHSLAQHHHLIYETPRLDEGFVHIHHVQDGD